MRHLIQFQTGKLTVFPSVDIIHEKRSVSIHTVYSPCMLFLDNSQMINLCKVSGGVCVLQRCRVKKDGRFDPAVPFSYFPIL